MKKIQTYIEEVLAEMKKVNWPKRKELVSSSVITLMATVALSLFIFGADRIITFILDIIYPS